MSGVGHVGEEAETSLRAGRQGQEGDEGAQTQTVTDVILEQGPSHEGSDKSWDLTRALVSAH